ncbi:MAG TPA: 2,3-bisphosphoglycerate-independent phosphoglycerate mutase [Solirubrobacteraceae bacterium]|nr:2,3-bisphosphoglycerate-independent phosphoglycerate mutase [Solirubrobacteraceae bacterium]
MTVTPGPSSLPVPRAALIVLDGWGLAPDGPGNAVSLASTPVFDELWQRYPTTTLTTCGLAVGLPEGQMGNSEVGHLNLGAGSVVMQDLTRIDAAAADGSMESNPVLRDAFSGASRVHVIGLVSDGGVHSSMHHLRALISMAAALGVSDLVVHAFTDGRDTLPTAGAGYLAEVESWMAEAGLGRIGSVVGRYYAMDRDRRWDRVRLAYDLLVHGDAPHRAGSGEQACLAAYERDETDEFITPTVVGASDSRIRPGDSVLGLNFRPDRMREITLALASPSFDGFDRGDGSPVATRYTTMTEYEEGWPYPVAFAPERPATTIGAVIAGRGERQLHVAETEKYPHVTYFFNGGEEAPYDGEERELVPSPRDVPTYDHKPAMSAPEAARAFVDAWTAAGGDRFRFGIINFANADMVGHTGVIPAAVEAVQTVDTCLGSVVEAVHATGGACLITADHGNADHMLEPDGSPNTAHSLNPVPVIVTVDDAAALRLREGGVLADVAPTLLAMLGIEQPPEMSGRSLLVPR